MSKQDHTVLVLVDVQEKLMPAIDKEALVSKNLEILVKGALELEIPIVWLEQYPKGLGRTIEPLRTLFEEKGLSPIEKMTFSGVPAPEFQTLLEKYDHVHFIVAGVETHVCVYQTVRDLLDLEYEVEVVSDAVSSRVEANTELGLNKMIQLGATLTSTEMFLFELLESAENPKFKVISKLIR